MHCGGALQRTRACRIPPSRLSERRGASTVDTSTACAAFSTRMSSCAPV
jgi:hypothetical protein